MLRAILIKYPKFRIARAFTTAVAQAEAPQDAIEYPRIVDNSFPEKLKRKYMAEYDRLKRCPTIEEKIIELNMPRFYGHRCVMLGDKWYPYNALPFVKFATKTDFQELPAIQDPAEAKKVDDFYNIIKSDLMDALEFELGGYYHSFKKDGKWIDRKDRHRMKASAIVKQLNRVLTRTLGADNGHLYEADVDFDPRIEAFWFIGGIAPPLKVKYARRKIRYLRALTDQPIKRGVQFKGTPLLALRHQNPLQPFDNIDFSQITEENKNIISETVASIDPKAGGWTSEHQHGVIVPGFWPGNVREYGLLSFYDRSILVNRTESFGDADHQDAIHALAINSSFSYAYGQACYHGFSTLNDITYPLCAQTVITDGKIWSFYRYQLNTTLIHTDLDGPNYKYNQCWGTNNMQLYDSIDENGKIQGFNDDVCKQLIRFYLAEPKARDYEMKPYLDPHEKKIADIEDVERRRWLENTYKHMVSNRPRRYLAPEIYDWERIYKIEHNTRPIQDKRMRFYDFKINPFRRRLDEHLPKYIPRANRPGGIYDKNKREATYYPLEHRSNKFRTMTNSEYGAAKSGPARKYDRFRRSYYI